MREMSGGWALLVVLAMGSTVAHAVTSVGQVSKGWIAGMDATLRSEVLQSRVPGTLQGPGSTARYGAFRQTLGSKLKGLAGRREWSLDTNFTWIKPDYSQAPLLDARQAEFRLSNRPETEVEAKLARESGMLRSQLAFTTPLSQAPYGYRGLQARNDWVLFDGMTVLRAEGTAGVQQQPSSFEINESFRVEERPRSIHHYTLAVGWEQVLSEDWKGLLKASTGWRPEDRPAQLGAELGAAYAVSSQVFAKLSVRHDREVRSQALKNSRGYFDASAAKFEVTVEPVLDLLASVSYGVAVEHESDPRADRRIQVGSDQYGLGLSYLFPGNRFAADVMGSLGLTNTATRSYAVSGGLRATL